MHIAFKNDKYNVIGILIKFGGNLNIMNYDGWTPPAYASINAIHLFDLNDCVKKGTLEEN